MVFLAFLAFLALLAQVATPLVPTSNLPLHQASRRRIAGERHSPGRFYQLISDYLNENCFLLII